MEKQYTLDKYTIAMFGHKRIPSREGGVEIVVEELATRMVDKGYRVVCYNRAGHHVSGSQFDTKPQTHFNGVELRTVHTMNIKGLAAMTASFSAAIKVCRDSFDIVHIHAEGPAAMSGIIKRSGKRVIVTIHGLDWKRAKWGRIASRYIKLGEKMAAKYADEIIVLSTEAQKYFLDTYNRQTYFIPNGVTAPKRRAAKEIIKNWGLETDGYVLFLGRIVPEKGIDYLINAWRTIETNKKLVITGGASDTQNYVDELKKTVGDNVVFTGFQQGEILEELYSNAYIYCLPSDVEGMPLSLLEAMSYGNCCLVSDIPECVEVVEDKAVTFPHGNVFELREALLFLLSDPDMVRKYKNSSAEYITKKYNWDIVVDKTIELYKKNNDCRVQI